MVPRDDGTDSTPSTDARVMSTDGSNTHEDSSTPGPADQSVPGDSAVVLDTSTVIDAGMQEIDASIMADAASETDAAPQTCEDLGCPDVENGQNNCVDGVCILTCNDGFNDADGHCVDVDECQLNQGNCAQVCTNLDGGYQCSCNDGFTLNADGLTCDDVDECAVDNGGCDVNAQCQNTAGSRECRCNDGYEGDGESCRDIDECAVDNGGCDVNAASARTPRCWPRMPLQRWLRG